MIPVYLNINLYKTWMSSWHLCEICVRCTLTSWQANTTDFIIRSLFFHKSDFFNSAPATTQKAVAIDCSELILINFIEQETVKAHVQLTRMIWKLKKRKPKHVQQAWEIRNLGTIRLISKHGLVHRPIRALKIREIQHATCTCRFQADLFSCFCL